MGAETFVGTARLIGPEEIARAAEALKGHAFPESIETEALLTLEKLGGGPDEPLPNPLL